MKTHRKISWTGLWVTIATEVVINCVSAMETHITVDCHSDPQNIIVNVHTDTPFEGMVYVSGKYGDLNCTAYGRKNTTTTLRVPIKGCNTHEKESGLFMSSVTVQQHPMIVSAGDGEYEVGCKLFQGDLRVDTGNRVEVGETEQKGPVMTSPAPGPEVLLRIYDFENDVFVDTVRLGQVVELEITIRNGSLIVPNQLVLGILERISSPNKLPTVINKKQWIDHGPWMLVQRRVVSSLELCAP